MAWWEGVDKTRVLIAPESENPKGEFLSLRHPKSGNKTCYLLINGSLQEIHWFKQPYGSWFLGDYVCEDGSLYVATPVDLVFILLPMFEEARMRRGTEPGKFRQLDEIMFVNGYPGYQNLFLIAEKSMESVCDCKEIGSTKFFRLNDSKVLAWLNCKVNQLEKTLPNLDKNYATRDHKEILADAVSLLGEYLKDEPWLNLLCRHLNIDKQESAIVQGSGILSTEMENDPLSFNPVPKEASGSDKKTTRSGRQTKKAKIEAKDSRSITEMFSRASRRK